jgi:fatty acid synthase subunit alpha, fungi type/fatty acid synthase subunit beta, fungi type
LPNIDIRDAFVRPEVTIDAATVECFCSVIGNQGELFKRARSAEVEAPTDFAIVTGWQVWLFTAALHSILTNDSQGYYASHLPRLIDGDLLKLVHLANGLRAVNSARPLKPGDVCMAEARIVSVINSDIGKPVKIKGNVLRGAEPVIEVNSSFLDRGRFTDCGNTFER